MRIRKSSLNKIQTIALLIYWSCVAMNLFSQGLAANACDSTILTRKEYEKCKLDSVWTRDIILKTNYISSFKTELLPKYRIIRKKIVLRTELQASVRDFKNTYDTVLHKKLAVFQKDMDKNQLYIQPKSYITSVLGFQVFRFYPDVYAILLNDIHLQLKPATSKDEMKSYQSKFETIIRSIPANVYDQLLAITTRMETENLKLMEKGFIPIFRGSIEDNYRKKCNMINFLLWDE